MSFALCAAPEQPYSLAHELGEQPDGRVPVQFDRPVGLSLERKGRRMSHMGRSHVVMMMTVGPDDVTEGDRLFSSHAEWMKGHSREGDVALLDYSVSKGPELANPLDPSSEPTGNTTFIIDEYYQSPAGIAAHWQDAMSTWSDLPALMAWAGKGTVATFHQGPVVQALW